MFTPLGVISTTLCQPFEVSSVCVGAGTDSVSIAMMSGLIAIVVSSFS